MSSQAAEQISEQMEVQQPSSSTTPVVPTVTGIPDFAGAYVEMNDPQFWISMLDRPDEVLLTAEQIQELNASIPETEGTNCIDLDAYPELLDRQALLDRIRVYGIPGEQRYIDATELHNDYYQSLFLNRNEAEAQKENVVQYGVITGNTELRTFPTSDVSYGVINDTAFDLNCETVLKTWERVAVLHESSDAEWLLVQSYNYLGWAAKDAVALTDRQTWLSLKENDWLVVTGNRILLDYSHSHPELSRKELTMGTRLPLLSDKPEQIDGISTVSSYAAQLPIRRSDGKLEIVPVRVPYGLDVSVGFLPYTQGNLIEQAFKMLGERYGWSGLWNARDCSSYIMDVYQCFGIDLPRNANNQAAVAEKRIDVSQMSDTDKKNLILSLPAGSLLEMRGHIVLYLGSYDGQPYVIHQTYRFIPADSKMPITVGCAIVSDLNIKRGIDESFLSGIRTVVSIA